MKISVIVPFYKGNKYLKNLINSVEKVAFHIREEFEIIIVNDSPYVDVELPNTQIETKVLVNEKNLGIQGSRIKGIRSATGEWVLLLDQDDELVVEGFNRQIELTQNSDVVVGNGTYILGVVNKKIFNNFRSMNYLIQKDRFIEIRNLIVSPGECLIRKESIPSIWMENKLEINGADDWMLWILLFCSNARFVCNDLPVYIHNDAGGTNLSADLDKMRESSLEMTKILHKYAILDDHEICQLRDSINFKYFQDTKQLGIKRLWDYRKALISNVKYRVALNVKYR